MTLNWLSLTRRAHAMKYEKQGHLISKTWWEIIALSLFIGVILGSAI